MLRQQISSAPVYSGEMLPSLHSDAPTTSRRRATLRLQAVSAPRPASTANPHRRNLLQPYQWRNQRRRPDHYAVWMWVARNRRRPGPVFFTLDDALQYMHAHGIDRCDVLLPNRTWYSARQSSQPPTESPHHHAPMALSRRHPSAG